MLKDYANLEITLGLLNHGAALPVGGGTGAVIEADPVEAKVMELREKLTDQEYDRLLQMCDELEASLQGWRMQVDESIAVTDAVAVSLW
jgi:hypothetical protein